MVNSTSLIGLYFSFPSRHSFTFLNFFRNLTASPSATVISFSFHSHSAATQQINTRRRAALEEEVSMLLGMVAHLYVPGSDSIYLLDEGAAAQPLSRSDLGDGREPPEMPPGVSALKRADLHGRSFHL